MKKMNILFILITSILIFGTTNVFADTCSQQYYNQLENNYGTVYPNNGTNFVNYNLPSNITFGNVNYIKGQLWYSLVQSNTTSYTSNINLTETCSHYHDNEMRYRIVYADGSTAQIESTMWNNICDIHSSSGTMTNTIYHEPQITSLLVSLYDSNNNRIICDTDIYGNFKCPVNNNTQYSRFHFQYTLSNVNNAILKYGMTTQWIQKCTSDTQQIINNNNQNTQTIVNNITTPNIDSNTTNTDNLITIPNSNGKNTILDLLMVPINFITSIVNSFSNSCVSYNLGNLLGTDLILPCINLQNILGSGLYNIIDVIFSFGMIFAFIRSVKKFIQKALLLVSDVSSEVTIF